MRRYPNVVRAVACEPWAILPDMLETIAEIVEFRLSGVSFSDADIRERTAGRVDRQESRVGVVQVLPLYGVLSKRQNLMTDTSGGTSLDLFARQFRAAVADPAVAGIVIDVDSPGGTVDGTPEAADVVYQARGSKRIVAVANTLMASAAYWVASAADEIVASPSAQVGSVGVVMLHADKSKFYEDLGTKITLLSAGKYKTLGNSYEPLTDEARSRLQSDVESAYDIFVRAVARNRGTTPKAVRDGYGEGAVLDAKPAVAAGLADRVGTFEEAVLRAAPRRAGMNARAARLARELELGI